jgi:hypothetical protein
MKHKNYMWREYPFIKKDKSYRFQTSDPIINRRMKQRSDFQLVLWGLNENIWVYQTNKYSLKDAKKTFSRVTRQVIKYDSFNEVYYAENGVIVDKNSKKKNT